MTATAHQTPRPDIESLALANARRKGVSQKGVRPLKGAGTEPDVSFYIGNFAQVMGRRSLDLEFDPPLDLAIEVDNTADSDAKLDVFSRLQVPELWRLDITTGEVWFGKLEAGHYQSIERSLCLPSLHPGLVSELLAEGENLDDTTWQRWLRTWVDTKITLPPAVE